MADPRPFPVDHPGHEFPAWVNKGKPRPALAPCPDPDCPTCAVEEASR